MWAIYDDSPWKKLCALDQSPSPHKKHGTHVILGRLLIFLDPPLHWHVWLERFWWTVTKLATTTGDHSKSKNTNNHFNKSKWLVGGFHVFLFSDSFHPYSTWGNNPVGGSTTNYLFAPFCLLLFVNGWNVKTSKFQAASAYRIAGGRTFFAGRCKSYQLMVEPWKNNRVVLHVLLNYTWQVPKHGAGSMDDVDCNKGDDVWEGRDQVNDQLLEFYFHTLNWH